MKLCMTVEEAAEAASVSYEQIQKWAKDIDFPCFKVGQRGGKRLIHVEAFNNWLRKRAELRLGEERR
nr:MAG TPA: Regulatory protein [Caudoviricetes sp.]